MAEVRLNPILDGVRGKIGDLVFKRFGDDTIISRLPNFANREFSEAQRLVHENFRQAAHYGSLVLADAAARAVYESVANARRQNLFSVVVEDFLRRPKVDEIDLSHYSGQTGGKIIVTASDDFEIVGVEVIITDVATSQLVEQGPAVKSSNGIVGWSYTATTSVPSGTELSIKATAIDRPGHKGSKTLTT